VLAEWAKPASRVKFSPRCRFALVSFVVSQVQSKSAAQETSMNAQKAKNIRALFAAYMANDRKAVEDTLTGDFRFTSPYDDQIDKKTYFERCGRDTGWIERHELEKILVEGDEAFVTYKCLAKGGKSFRNTEFFAFEGDKVNRIDVYFGATYQNDVFVRQNVN
jgi:ketosteroid isomerase-like protein